MKMETSSFLFPSESCENLIKTKQLTFTLIVAYFFDEKLFLESLLLQVSLFLSVCVYALCFSLFSFPLTVL